MSDRVRGQLRALVDTKFTRRDVPLVVLVVCFFITGFANALTRPDANPWAYAQVAIGIAIVAVSFVRHRNRKRTA